MKISTRFFLDRAHIIRRVGKGRAKALRSAGAMVYRSVQKEFKSGTPSPRGSIQTVGTFPSKWRSLPLYERRTRKPKANAITSWKGRRSPKGFMRTAMAFAYDTTTDSVVIGPRYKGWLNVLHERGGSQTQRLYLRFRGRPVPRQAAFGLKKTGNRSDFVYVGTYMHPRPTTSNFRATGRTRQVRVRASSYQRKGLDRVRQRIPERFRGQISGP